MGPSGVDCRMLMLTQQSGSGLEKAIHKSHGVRPCQRFIAHLTLEHGLLKLFVSLVTETALLWPPNDSVMWT